MTTSYRDAVARCPACKTEMNERQVDEALIDVCPACHGLWFDWLDGDTFSLTVGVMPLSMRAPVVVPIDATCPRCTKPLESRAHDGAGPILHRCSDCAGSFITREAATALLEWEPPPSVKPPEAPNWENAPLTRLLIVLRSIFAKE
jgi:Zn-finger nucleic acid-binding protein